jgi:hypothetical protein
MADKKLQLKFIKLVEGDKTLKGCRLVASKIPACFSFYFDKDETCKKCDIKKSCQAAGLILERFKK